MTFTFPPAILTTEEEDFRLEVREFLIEALADRRIQPRCSGWMAFDRDFSELCGSRGLIGLTWPKAYGGGGRSTLARYVVMEEMLAAGAPVGAHWIADRQSGPQILLYGKEELRAELLPRICRGQVSFAIGMSEPDAGSDLASIRSRAAPVSGGWLLNGRKVWTTNGHRADYMIGLFRTGERHSDSRHANMTQFVVDLHSDGVKRRGIDDLTGAADFSEITFDDVFVPDIHVLGEAGQGWALVTDELANERSGPERFLSVMPLLAAAVEAAWPSENSARNHAIGRLVAHVAVMREMSGSIAAQIANGAAPALEAAMTKDLGNALERQMPEAFRSACGLFPAGGADQVRAMLHDVVLAAPSFTLRGGTPEVLHGIIARGLGLR